MTTPDAEAQRRLNQVLRKHRGDSEAWARLGEMLTARRQLLGYDNRRQFIRERGEVRGLNEKFIYDLEGGPRWGRQGFGAGKMLAVAEAYAVTVGSVADALDGGELVPAPAGEPAPQPAVAAAIPRSENDTLRPLMENPRILEEVGPYYDAITARVVPAVMRMPAGTVPPGALVFDQPGEEWLAHAWDLFAGQVHKRTGEPWSLDDTVWATAAHQRQVERQRAEPGQRRGSGDTRAGLPRRAAVSQLRRSLGLRGRRDVTER